MTLRHGGVVSSVVVVNVTLPRLALCRLLRIPVMAILLPSAPLAHFTFRIVWVVAEVGTLPLGRSGGSLIDPDWRSRLITTSASWGLLEIILGHRGAHFQSI